jgi:DNA-binding transcriptional LysR family regulator
MYKKNPLHPDCQMFLLVAEMKNISKAAETLGSGQSGVSKAIQRLEAELHCKLFIRRNQGVELTREGQRFLVGLLASQNAWALSFNRQENLGLSGKYSIGGHNSVLTAFLAKPLSQLLLQHTSLDFEIIFNTSVETTRLVAALKLDFGVVINHVRSPDLVAKKIGEDFIALWKNKNTSPKWICYNPEMLDVTKLTRRFQKRRLVAMTDYQLIYNMVLAGESEGLLPNGLIKDPQIQNTSGKLREVQVSLICHSANAKLDSFKQISKAFETSN